MSNNEQRWQCGVSLLESWRRQARLTLAPRSASEVAPVLAPHWGHFVLTVGHVVFRLSVAPATEKKLACEDWLAEFAMMNSEITNKISTPT